MLTEARLASSAASGVLSFSVTVFASVASTLETEARDAAATAAVVLSLILSSENFTSAESKVLPSANFTP